MATDMTGGEAFQDYAEARTIIYELRRQRDRSLVLETTLSSLLSGARAENDLLLTQCGQLRAERDEARRWARKMLAERDVLLAEVTELQAKLRDVKCSLGQARAWIGYINIKRNDVEA